MDVLRKQKKKTLFEIGNPKNFFFNRFLEVHFTSHIILNFRVQIGIGSKSDGIFKISDPKNFYFNSFLEVHFASFQRYYSEFWGPNRDWISTRIPGYFVRFFLAQSVWTFLEGGKVEFGAQTGVGWKIWLLIQAILRTLF